MGERSLTEFTLSLAEGFEMTNTTTVIPSVCEESFPIVLMLTGVELHHHRLDAMGLTVIRLTGHEIR